MGFFTRLTAFQQPNESLLAFSKRLGVSYTSMRLYKHGSIPTAAKAFEIATKLGISPSWLVFGEEENKPELPSNSLT